MGNTTEKQAAVDRLQNLTDTFYAKIDKLRDALYDLENVAEDVGRIASDVQDETQDEIERRVNPTVVLLEDIGLSTERKYSVLDIERLKIAVKWALEGE